MRRGVFRDVWEPKRWRATPRTFFYVWRMNHSVSLGGKNSLPPPTETKICAFPDLWWLTFFFPYYLNWEKLNASPWDFGIGCSIRKWFRMLCSYRHGRQLPEVTVISSICSSEVASLMDSFCDVISAVDSTSWLPFYPAHFQRWFSNLPVNSVSCSISDCRKFHFPLKVSWVGFCGWS